MNFIMSSGVNAAYILDSHGSSGLHSAAEFGHTNIIDRLLRVRSSDNAISTRLVIFIVDKYVKAGTTYQIYTCYHHFYFFSNSDNRGWTPIHLAAKNGHLEALELLVQNSPLRETCEIVDEDHVS